MAIPTKPDNLANVIGFNADTSTIADTTTAGTAELSYESGFPAKVSNALAAGGAPLKREDLNAIVKLLSAHVHYLQSGSLYEWDSALNYNKGAHILGSDGAEYVAQADSGPETGAGAQDPTADTEGAYWKEASGLYGSSVPCYFPVHFAHDSSTGAAQTLSSAIPGGKTTVTIDFIGADMQAAVAGSSTSDLSMTFHEIDATDTSNDVTILVQAGNSASCAALAGKCVEITLGDSTGSLTNNGTAMLKYS